jgi:hypothetical protein
MFSLNVDGDALNLIIIAQGQGFEQALDVLLLLGADLGWQANPRDLR